MPQNNFYTLQCYNTKKTFSEEDFFSGKVVPEGPVDIIYDYERIKQRLNFFALRNAPISSMKYLDFYPIKDLTKVVTLKEGGTPLYHAQNLGSEFGLQQLYIKNDGANPTGVFKDRGSLTELTKAVEIGAKAVCLASSGNMAASVSAYSALAGIPCYVLVPEATPIGKLVQIISYGGRVIQVRSDYSTCAKLAEEIAQQNKFYLAGDYVYRREGQKSCAYEIVEQLNWQAPDYLVCPIGCGTNFSAIWKGFKEFYHLGLINKMPKMIAVQPTGSPTIVDAYNKKSKHFETIKSANTICSAVAITNPLDGNIALEAIYSTDGGAFEISDEDTLIWQQKIAKHEAIFTEPSGAIPVAALDQLIKKFNIKPHEKIVCISCGNGLKDPITVLKHLSTPPTMDANIEEINRYLSSPISKMASTYISKENAVLWKKAPTKEIVKKSIKENFEVEVSNEILDQIYQEVLKFDAKDKHIRGVDLQTIINNVVKEFSIKKPIVSITNYDVKVHKKERSHAQVQFKFHDKEISISADGVGPVDALITALRQGINAHSEELNCQLVDYNVRIKTKGTASAVEVEIKVKDNNNNNNTVGSATSPDIIEASIEAFVKGYNALYWMSQK